MQETGRTRCRVVVKVGTSTLTDAHGRVDRAYIADLTAQLATLHKAGNEVLLVTSGAIRAGRDALTNTPYHKPLQEPPSPAKMQLLPYKQAAAAIGQGLLVHTYTEAFAWRNVRCAQVLLTADDLSERRRFLNARNTLLTLLELGVVPVINENDTIAVDEIKFGDNDTLAALVATLVEADLLLILSDVDGLYTKPPVEGEPKPPIIPIVTKIDDAVTAAGGETAANGVGTGGMRTKLAAARIATQAGIPLRIANGRRERVTLEAVAGEPVGTLFVPLATAERLSARKRWIAHSARPKGWVVVNAGAKQKICTENASLLAVGILTVGGRFHSGDLIAIRDEEGNEFACGLSNYTLLEVKCICGRRSEEFEEILGYRGFDEVIHRDNLVVG